MGWINKPQAIDLSVACIEAIGTRDFFEPFLQLIHCVLSVDQCILFTLTPSGRMTCLLSCNFHRDEVASSLAEDYISDAYESDPNFKALSLLNPGETRITHLLESLSLMPDQYRKKFFSAPGLTDKVSIMTSDGHHRYYLNLYRGAARQTFLDEALFDAPMDGRLLSSLIVQNYRVNTTLRDEGPLAFLSDRERQVCQGILSGKKMEAIATDLAVAVSSAVTYRKRAYQKLGISSRSALFALCNS